MLHLSTLIESLPSRPKVEELLGEFVPPARFAGKRFANYQPAHPSQAAAAERLQRVAGELSDPKATGVLDRFRRRWKQRERGYGIYLDGGFGVGKTHLLAALWHQAPFPKAYLSFDSFVSAFGYLSGSEFSRVFLHSRLLCIDEWELDDPGNLTMALAGLRRMLEHGVRVIATSNTLPLELGEGRFSQKDFLSEIAEMSAAFEVLTLRGEDYRHRRYEANPGRQYFVSAEELVRRATQAGDTALLVEYADLVHALRNMRSFQYRSLLAQVGSLFVVGLGRTEAMADALRFVQLIDRAYNYQVPLTASSDGELGEVFTRASLTGPYGKKFSRCISRLEEMLLASARP